MKLLPAIALLAAAALSAHGSGSVRVMAQDAAGAPVADAVASVTPVGAPVKVVPPAEPVAITQQDQEFSPYVTPIVVGTRVVFPNRDTVQHHVYSVSAAKRFEIPLYTGESKAAVVFDRAGVVTLGCNIHDWMVAYVVVLATPYFAKTGADGTADISGLPPGEYHLEVWHPRAAIAMRDITVTDAAGATLAISLALKPNRRIRRAPDASGAEYK